MAENSCPECGSPRGIVPVDEPAAETVTHAEVEIARINADRDIKLAQIGAKVAGSELVAENAALAAENEAQAEAMDTVVEIVSPEPAEPAEPVIIAPPDPDPEPMSGPEDLPEPELSAPPTGGKRGLSWY